MKCVCVLFVMLALAFASCDGNTSGEIGDRPTPRPTRTPWPTSPPPPVCVQWERTVIRHDGGWYIEDPWGKTDLAYRWPWDETVNVCKEWR